MPEQQNFQSERCSSSRFLPQPRLRIMNGKPEHKRRGKAVLPTTRKAIVVLVRQKGLNQTLKSRSHRAANGAKAEKDAPAHQKTLRSRAAGIRVVLGIWQQCGGQSVATPSFKFQPAVRR